MKSILKSAFFALTIVSLAAACQSKKTEEGSTDAAASDTTSTMSADTTMATDTAGTMSADSAR